MNTDAQGKHGYERHFLTVIGAWSFVTELRMIGLSYEMTGSFVEWESGTPAQDTEALDAAIRIERSGQ